MVIMFEANEIKALREALGLTPTQFAFRLGVSASAVCYWEKGKKCPRPRIMRLLNELDKQRNQPAAAGAS